MKDIVLLGSGGFLAAEFPDDILKFKKTDVDVLNFNEIRSKLSALKPKFVINCAGIVDRKECDRDPLLAYHVNVAGTLNIAVVANILKAKLIQFSTICDLHDDVYSRTKRIMAEVVKNSCRNYSIIKLPSLFNGDTTKGCLKDLCREIAENKTATYFGDENFYPTGTKDVVDYVMQNISVLPTVVTLINAGMPARLEFARKVVEFMGINDETISFIEKKRAPREYSFENLVVLRNWKVSLKECFRKGN